MAQGLTLSPLIRRLRLGNDPTLELEEVHARQEAGRAALAHLDKLAQAPDAPRADNRADAHPLHAASPARLLDRSRG